VEFFYGVMAAGAFAIALALLLYVIQLKKRPKPPTVVEVKKENLDTLTEFVRLQKERAEEEARVKELKKAENREKLENFKRTKDELQDRLRAQFSEKAWRPLASILNSADKGGVGIYVLFNASKNKYYVGQAKQIFKRVRDHFAVEDIARDYLCGDEIRVKFLTANEIGADYRLDHIERTGIEIFDADKGGYNRTTGNL
jgi:hypothetical protein